MVVTASSPSTAGRATWLTLCLLVVLYAIADLLFNVWTSPTGLFLFLSLLSSAATITTLFRPLAGVALAAIPMAADLVISFDFGAAPLVITTLVMAAKVQLKTAVPVLLAIAGLRVAHLTWSPDGTERAFVFSIIFVVCLVVGATIRWLIGHAGRSHTELALLDKHIQAIRRDEREALADELSGTLADDLRATGQLLENPLGLAEIDERARSSLTRLRRLVSTLRAEPEATQRHSGNLLGALEEAEDFLVGHGFPVELQTTEAAVLPSDLDIGALLVALREASDHIRLHCAGGVAHIALATAPDGAILTVTHRAEDAESPGWTHTCHLSTRAASAPTSATADPPRRPLLTRVGLTTVRWVLTAPAVIAAVPWLVGALDPSAPQAERGLSLAWAAAFLALALATWMPRVAVSLMATTALASIVALSAPPTFSAFDILGVFLASVVATKWPRALAAIPVGTALCAAWWYRDPADPLPIFAAAVFPAFGAALGLGVRHFLRLRAEHLAEYERLKDAYNTARANERAQLAGDARHRRPPAESDDHGADGPRIVRGSSRHRRDSGAASPPQRVRPSRPRHAGEPHPARADAHERSWRRPERSGPGDGSHPA
ncbi:MAG: hypothetical protein IPL36_03295 [Nigerium sp.]|nr:hypothetical protein [Nigerium sp.]